MDFVLFGAGMKRHSSGKREMVSSRHRGGRGLLRVSESELISGCALHLVGADQRHEHVDCAQVVVDGGDDEAVPRPDEPRDRQRQ